MLFRELNAEEVKDFQQWAQVIAHTVRVARANDYASITVHSVTRIE